MTIAQNTIEHSDIADRLPSFWWPRFKRLATFFSETEYIRAKEHTLKKTEAKGSITVAGTSFKLSAIADRIDRARDGSYSAIDYKSGGTFTPNKIANGTLPQLPITGLILRDGGFKDIGKASIGSLSYWVLTGGRKAGTITAQTNDIDQTIAAVQENLQTLIAAFDNSDTPYICLPRPDHMPRFNDYNHLSRLQEWSADGDQDGEVAA